LALVTNAANPLLEDLKVASSSDAKPTDATLISAANVVFLLPLPLLLHLHLQQQQLQHLLLIHPPLCLLDLVVLAATNLVNTLSTMTISTTNLFAANAPEISKDSWAVKRSISAELASVTTSFVSLVSTMVALRLTNLLLLFVILLHQIALKDTQW